MRLNQTQSKSGSAKQSSLHGSNSAGGGTTAGGGASGTPPSKLNSISRNREVKLLPAGATAAAASTTATGASTTKAKGLHQLSTAKTVLNPQNIGSVPRNPAAAAAQHQRNTSLLKAGAVADTAAAGSSSLGSATDLMTEKSRRVLEEIQKTKNNLLKQQQQLGSSSSGGGAVPGNLFLGSGAGPTAGSHFPQLQIPSGSIPSSLPNPHLPHSPATGIIGNPIDASGVGLSPIQRSALHLLQQANTTSFGSYISTDSHFGNGIFPVLPRLVNNNIANSNSNSPSGNNNSGSSSGIIKIT